MDRVFATVIGGGAVGLASARAISRRVKQGVLVLERNGRFGVETSSRNSEVIHASVYYPHGSLKSRACLSGNKLLYQLCKEVGIPYVNCGKLVVATSKEQVPRLEHFLKIAQDSGGEGLRILSAQEVSEMEPEVASYGAIYCPTSGVVDSYAYMEYLETDIGQSGGDVVYKTTVMEIEKISGGGYRLLVADESGATSTIDTKYLLNSAGHGACTIAKKVGIDPELSGYKLYPVQGMYARAHAQLSRYPKTLIYPLPPEKGGVGAHTCPDLHGGMRIGPYDQRLLDTVPDQKWDYRVPDEVIPLIGDEIRAMLPWVKDEDLSPDTSGVHPKLTKPGDPVMKDFILSHEEAWGLPNFINLIGIESPGLTSSLALGSYVTDCVEHLEHSSMR